jgi:integrase
MKCNFYLDRPYNPEINREIVKKEVAAARAANRKLAVKYLNPKKTSVYIFFSPDKNTRLKYRTSIKIQPRHWDFKNGLVKPTAPGSIELNGELNEISTALIKQTQRLKDEHAVVSVNDFKKILIDVVDKDNMPKDKDDLKLLIGQFKKYKAIYCSSETMKEYSTVFLALDGYQTRKKQVLTLLDFNKDFYANFEDYLSKKKNPKDEERGLLNDTIHKYITTLKTFLTWCTENGHTVHPDTFKKHHSAFKRKTHNEIVVLTETELNKLYELDLSKKPRYDRVRDLFCFACFTGQRFSDIMRFNKNDLKDNIWTFVSAKTKKKVSVPFNGFIATGLEILKKYDYKLPMISNQKFNDYIKEVGKLAKINEPVRIVRYNGKKEIVFEKPKYDFMSSHMGRRTMVTILLSKGVPISLVQKITQHSDIRTLMKYESAGMDSLVDALNKI